MSCIDKDFFGAARTMHCFLNKAGKQPRIWKRHARCLDTEAWRNKKPAADYPRLALSVLAPAYFLVRVVKYPFTPPMVT